jgi:hypothetical protein
VCSGVALKSPPGVVHRLAVSYLFHVVAQSETVRSRSWSDTGGTGVVLSAASM